MQYNYIIISISVIYFHRIYIKIFIKNVKDTIFWIVVSSGNTAWGMLYISLPLVVIFPTYMGSQTTVKEV
jgi:hypothetical protein